MSVVDDIWQCLDDGEWHSAADIGKNFVLSVNTVHRILHFLSKYDFVKLDETNLRVKTCNGASIMRGLN